MDFIKFMKEGGFFMFPILIVGVLGIAIVIERLIYLYKVKKKNQKTWHAIQHSMKQNDLAKMQAEVKHSHSEMARSLDYGLSVYQAGGNEEHIASAFEEGVLETIPRLEARTGYVVVLGNIATLLGLLGTVSGLNHAFKSVATADPALKGDLLAAAIAEAMNCTAFGLVFAVPLILAYTFLSSYTTQIVDSIEMMSMKVQNKIRQIRIMH